MPSKRPTPMPMSQRPPPSWETRSWLIYRGYIKPATPPQRAAILERTPTDER